MTSMILVALALTARVARADEASFMTWYLGTLEGFEDTTALRREIKAVVKKRHAKQFRRELERLVGPLQLRDVPPPGRVNLTSTDYLNTGEVLPELLGYSAIPAGSISPKIRLRKYMTRDREGAVQVAPVTAGCSMLELKMPHPNRPGVSLKPRLVIQDAQLPLLLDARQFGQRRTRDAISATLKGDARNDPATVDRFITLFGQLHARKQGNRLKPWINTEYRRSAYMIPLPGGANIQVTFDREVRFRHPRKGKVLRELGRGWRAVEVKIPDAYAAMSDAQLRGRGLGLVADVRALQGRLLAARSVKGLKPGGGKCSAFSRLSRKLARKLKSRGSWRRPASAR